MQYITSVERIRMKRGAIQNARQSILDALDVRSGRCPPSCAIALGKSPMESVKYFV